jgi:hypothetical protein
MTPDDETDQPVTEPVRESLSAAADPSPSKWDDPVVKAQLRQFRASVEKVKKDAPRGQPAVDWAEYLCERSRGISNQAFGRAGTPKLKELDDLFRETAALVRSWDVSMLPSEVQSTVRAYAEHIGKRVEHAAFEAKDTRARLTKQGDEPQNRDGRPSEVSRLYNFPVSLIQRIEEEKALWSSRGTTYTADEIVAAIVRRTEPAITLNEPRDQYQVRLPRDVDDALIEISIRNKMSIEKALCAVLDRGLVQRRHAAQRSEPKGTHTEDAKDRKTGSDLPDH